MKPALALEIPQVTQKEGHFFAGHGNNQPEKVIKIILDTYFIVNEKKL
jgi:hypothetical protein